MKQLREKLLLGFLLLVFSLAPIAGARAMENEDCQGCHSDSDTVGEGFTIDLQTFDHTIHAAMGCLGCHESVSAGHPDDGVPPSKAVCLDCHQEIDQQYRQSAHAENAGCGDCHNPHRVRGLTEVSGYDMNRQCARCHAPAEVVQIHARWLPQAELHIAMLPCVSCHTASKDYVIVLNIIQRESAAVFGDFVLADYQTLKKQAGDRAVQRLIDLNGDDFVSLTELRSFNRNPLNKALLLKGTLTPKEITHNVETLDNRWDCSFCHASGPEAMQTSYLALPTEDGSYRRIKVERGAVLQALNGTPDFYMIGTTRSASLNILGLLIILGGCLMPLGHGALRFLTRKNRQNKEE